MNLQTRYQLLTLTAITTLTIGTVFYHFVEGWSLLDALYFSVVTLATVGFGDFTPKTAIGKLFTIFYILAGISIIAAFARSLLERRVKQREKRGKKKR